MNELVLTITNPLKFMTEENFCEKLKNSGYPEEVVYIKILKDINLSMEIELHFKFAEIGQKFYTKYNGKSFCFSQNYKLNIKNGKSNIKHIKKEKEIIYEDKYDSWVDTHYMLKINEEGLILVNPQHKEIQKKIIGILIQKINSSFIKGYNIFNYSFPLDTHDKRTLLQILAYELREAPYILYKVNFSSDPIEKLKFMTSFVISQIFLSPLRILPIKPILGETYQVNIGNLYCYFEQTKINPPTTNIYCFDSEGIYKIYGYTSIHSKTGINNCKILKKGNIYIEFKDKQKYKIYYPCYYIGGITIGKRSFNVKDSSLVIDETNRLVSYTKFFDKNKNYDIIKYPDEFEGKLISINEIKIDEKGSKHLIIEEDSIPLARFNGAWTKELDIDDKVYWKRNKTNLCKLYQPDYKLKSDSSLRPDLKLYNENNLEEAEKVFINLYKRQLRDCQLRQKYKK